MNRNYPVFETERIKLRELRIEDAEDIFILRADERVNKYIDRPKAQSVNEASVFIDKIINNIAEQKCFYWGITLKNEGKVIGTICLWNFTENEDSAEIGYELIPEQQGKGLVQEGLYNVLKFGFRTLKLESISALVKPDNKKSIKVLERNKFEYGSVKEEMHIYVLLKRNFV